MHEIIVADIGGTHARFAIANMHGGKVADLSDIVTMQCSEHASLQIAWEAYGRQLGRKLPRDGALALAGPVGGDVIYFTNSSWIVRPAQISEKLGLDRFTLINDFGAVGHAVAVLDKNMFSHVCGPDQPDDEDGIITIVGPGTGLGVAHVLRLGGDYHVTETEGGHVDFTPLDGTEDQLLDSLRKQHNRVSAERVIAGPGLKEIYHLLASIEGVQPKILDDKALWSLALSGTDSIVNAAFGRFCMCLGSFAGDLALAQGAKSVVIAGGLGQRISEYLPTSGFKERFGAKGRFRSLMEQIPVKQLQHPEPGLYGAAAAFIQEHIDPLSS